MENYIRKINTIVILTSILGILLGAGLIMKPDLSLEIIGILVGVVLMLTGVSLIYFDFKAREYYVPFDGLLLGIVNIVLSVLLLRNPSEIRLTISFAVGAWIIISSFNDIKMAYTFRRLNIPWVAIIFINIVDILIGAYMLYSPLDSSIAVIYSVGIVMIVNSIVRIIDMILIRTQINEAERYVRQRLVEFEEAAAPEIEAIRKAADEIKKEASVEAPAVVEETVEENKEENKEENNE